MTRSTDRLRQAYEVVLGPQYGDDDREAIPSGDCAARGILVSVSTVEADSGSVELRLSVANETTSEVSEVVFPDIELEPLAGPSGFTMPVGPGWWQPFEPLDEGEGITWNYPVYGSMQWVDYGGRASGTYVGVHDSTPVLKLWTVGRRKGRPWLRIRFTDLRLLPGEQYELPPVVVWEHNGDWHEGAKFYRSWAESFMEKPTGAEWYDEAPAWCWSGFRGQHARKPGQVYAEAPAGAVVRSRYGVKLTNAGGWVEHGHDTHYPDYFAGESMGGAEGLVRAIDQIHAAGLRISLYTNGRIADPEGSVGRMPGWLDWAVQSPGREHVGAVQRLHANFQPTANPNVYWNTSGAAVTETYGKVTFAVMCPGSAEWRELFISRIETIARDYNADGTFIDQVCGAWAYPCYSEDHDHSRPNEAWAGYLTLLRELRSRLRAINPEFQMTTEGVCDVFGQFFDVQQGHNDWDTQVGTKARPLPELYGYTFPWYTVNTGFAIGSNYYYLKLAHAVGSGLDLCDLDGDRCEERFLAYVRQIMMWRARHSEVLRRGEFIGALECDSEHYLAHAFEGTGRVVVTAGWAPYRCDPERPARVRLRLPGRVAQSARVSTEEGDYEAQIRIDRADTLITVPVSDIAVITVEL